MHTFLRPALTPEAGAALPMPIGALARMDVALRRSEVSMIAGAPGSGKSSLALVLALRIGAPTLYVAADTSEWTMRVRTLATLTGALLHSCEQSLVRGDANFAPAGHIAWCFDASPTVATVADEVAAYAEVHGAAPELIVVDNLSDVTPNSGGDEWTALRHTMKALKTLARDTEAAVLVLHHTSEGKDYSSFQRAPGRAAIQGKVAQLPALILTIDSIPDTQTMQVGVTKNRYGAARANGSLGATLRFDATRMQIGDPLRRF